MGVASARARPPTARWSTGAGDSARGPLRAGRQDAGVDRGARPPARPLRAGQVSMPGGDDFGSRPIDFHLGGLEAMGAPVPLAARLRRGGRSTVAGRAGRQPGRARVPEPHRHRQLLMAAVLAKGTTVIENAAREPEVATWPTSSTRWAPRSRVRHFRIESSVSTAGARCHSGSRTGGGGHLLAAAGWPAARSSSRTAGPTTWTCWSEAARHGRRGGPAARWPAAAVRRPPHSRSTWPRCRIPGLPPTTSRCWSRC